jgi:integrase/recombinase XerD
LSFCFGSRPQEIHDRKWHHINWEEKLLHVFCEKTQEPRDLPLDEALSHLKRWKEEWVLPDPTEDDYILPSGHGVRLNRAQPLSIEYICRLIKRIAKKAGINRAINTYLMRHSRMTYVRVKCGVSGPVFKKYAGHVPGSTQEDMYVHLDNSDMISEINEKVYKVQELTKSERDQFHERIARLESQLQEVLRFLRDSRPTMSAAHRQF